MSGYEEDGNAAIQEIAPGGIWHCIARIALTPRILSGLVRALHWVPPKLHWPVGAWRKKSLIECPV